MANKNNYNVVTINIPLEGEYILSIGNHMLVIKEIDEGIFQFSEFTKFTDNYRMTSVNCNSSKPIRIMEEFCKSHNCPKRILREEISKAEKSFKKISDVDIDTYNELREQSIAIISENDKLKNKNSELKNSVNKYYYILTEMISRFANIQSCLDDFHKEFKDIFDKIYSISNIDTLINIENSGIYISDDLIKTNEMDDSDAVAFMYEKIKEFMISHSISKKDSKCVIKKFYEEFLKTIKNNEYGVSYDTFIDFLKDIYSNNNEINVEGDIITNIVYGQENNICHNSNTSRSCSSNIMNKEDVVAETRGSHKKQNFNPDNKSTCRIADEHKEDILTLWRDHTAPQIVQKYPQYTVAQIGSFCCEHSGIRKRGTLKSTIATLKSFQGTKTLGEMGKEVGLHWNKVKSICTKHQIPYKTNL